MTIKYRRNGREASASEALDQDGILRDGFSLLVPLAMRDSVRLHDGHGGTPGHRPGFAMFDITNDDERARAYREYDARMATEYFGDARREGREGTICTVRNAQFPRAQGAPGHIRNGICVPDDEEQRDALPTHDANMTLDAIEARHRQRMSAEYSAYDARVREMWRNT
jgi:hypothetical protein